MEAAHNEAGEPNLALLKRLQGQLALEGWPEGPEVNPSDKEQLGTVALVETRGQRAQKLRGTTDVPSGPGASRIVPEANDAVRDQGDAFGAATARPPSESRDGDQDTRPDAIADARQNSEVDTVPQGSGVPFLGSGGAARGKKDARGREVVTDRDERSRILRLYHESPLAGHFGVKRTLEKIQRRYTWPNIRQDVTEYVRSCLRCRKAKDPRHSPYGELNPLPVPDGPWQWVTLDFITDLPPSRLGAETYDTILVVMDKFTKMAHYIPTRKDIDAKTLGNIFLREVIRLHGVPRVIVSDRGPILTSKFWKTFCHYLSVDRRLGTAFHPQTDGQTERQNQTLEQYLRIFCCFEQDDWAIWLSTAEFSYNDSVHSTTGFTPFFAYTGRHPYEGEWPREASDSATAPQAMDVVAQILSIQRTMKSRLEEARKYQAKYYNKRRKPLTLSPGQKVLLSSKHIKTIRPSKKLDSRYLGPYEVLEAVGSSAYRLKIPAEKKIHPVFHVSLLEPVSDKKSPYRGEEEFGDDGIDLNDPDVYEVERIDGQQLSKDGIWKYKVIWKGYPESEASWEPAENITEAAMKEYRRKSGQLGWKRKRQAPDPEEAPAEVRGRGRPPKRRKA